MKVGAMLYDTIVFIAYFGGCAQACKPKSFRTQMPEWTGGWSQFYVTSRIACSKQDCCTCGAIGARKAVGHGGWMDVSSRNHAARCWKHNAKDVVSLARCGISISIRSKCSAAAVGNLGGLAGFSQEELKAGLGLAGHGRPGQEKDSDKT
jgi:hypothetical protein